MGKPGEQRTGPVEAVKTVAAHTRLRRAIKHGDVGDSTGQLGEEGPTRWRSHDRQMKEPVAIGAAREITRVKPSRQ